MIAECRSCGYTRMCSDDFAGKQVCCPRCPPPHRVDLHSPSSEEYAGEFYVMDEEPVRPIIYVDKRANA